MECARNDHVWTVLPIPVPGPGTGALTLGTSTGDSTSFRRENRLLAETVGRLLTLAIERHRVAEEEANRQRLQRSRGR